MGAEMAVQREQNQVSELLIHNLTQLRKYILNFCVNQLHQSRQIQNQKFHMYMQLYFILLFVRLYNVLFGYNIHHSNLDFYVMHGWGNNNRFQY
ncbi:unnamed protein product [Paramecium pentaurelia]|uniref:Transmembrane protein n=1 Tax=Paramecium pentaurelia TaxID=43138 RepID=A0A8S1VHN8_9CILI|nr:unnamed protein product [Paramecium pentaurelia]